MLINTSGDIVFIYSQSKCPDSVLKNLMNKNIFTSCNEDDRSIVTTIEMSFKTKESKILSLELSSDTSLTIECFPFFNPPEEVTGMIIMSHEPQHEHSVKFSRGKNNALTEMSQGINFPIAQDEKMRRVIDLAKLVATVNSTVLITGETGTGKEVIAQFIHDHSDRSECNFVRVNCGAIAPNLIESELFGYEPGAFTGANAHGKVGLIEASSNGTLFLDEVSELPMDQQVKLLQVLQENFLVRVGGTMPRQLNLRIIVATNKDLESQIKLGKFREDLFYRINVVPIQLPPLRERCNDVPVLIAHFLKQFNDEHNRNVVISDLAFDNLCKYEWPGNIRELKNTIERLVITSTTSYVDITDLPEKISLRHANADIKVTSIIPLQDALNSVEKQLLQIALQRYDNEKQIGNALGINQSTVSRKLSKHSLIKK